MRIKYTHSKLSDGSNVNITYELKKQLKAWENQGINIENEFVDTLKRLDHEALKKDRNYYIHNDSLDSKKNIGRLKEKVLMDSSFNVEDIVIRRERKSKIYMILERCTEKQKRRFIKYYYMDLSMELIAEQESCSIVAIHKSIKKVEEKIINQKILL